MLGSIIAMITITIMCVGQHIALLNENELSDDEVLSDER
jgi:hypothetical protein